MDTSQTNLPLPESDRKEEMRWFRVGGRTIGCVREGGCGTCHVYVGGALIGSYDRAGRDLGPRNVLVVSLSRSEGVRLGELAAAFGMTAEHLRRLRRKADAEGMAALFTRASGGRETKVTKPLRKKLEKLFGEGLNAKEAYRRVKERYDIGETTVWKVHKEWKERQPVGNDTEAAKAKKDARQPREPTTTSPAAGSAARRDVGQRQANHAAGEAAAAPHDAEGQDPAVERLESRNVQSRAFVQHVGVWLMLAMVGSQGLYRAMEKLAGPRYGAMRIAMDAVIAAFTIGERCVEGVRRLAAPCGATLLRAQRVPTATWVREKWHRLARHVWPWEFHLEMAGRHLAEARERCDEAMPLYIDNHLRPYTGKREIRRTWRMQDKRARPGITDYYLHNGDGRPLLRVSVPENDGLTSHLSSLASLVKEALGERQRVLFAFDRAGSHPRQLVDLRERGIEFVTYERKPYQLLPATAFDRSMEFRGQKLGLHEKRLKNLGKGRGRVRRVALLMPDGHQVNLLAVSEKESPENLAQVMLLRWRQENAFKHGNERWGINELDSREVVTYPPDARIPSPDRRQLDNELRLARHQEGRARNALARYEEGSPRYKRAQQDLAEALARQKELEELRPVTPQHAPVKETKLHGKLVKHRQEYKQFLDTVRIACANAESELAARLAPHLARGEEAKKTLANLLNAPGAVTARKSYIEVQLQPPATARERRAFELLLHQVHDWRLPLPGDSKERPLRFAMQPVS